MTPNEFKAWFDGFTEAFENRIPTKDQWSRIKARVAEIDGKEVTRTVYVDRYLPGIRPYPYWGYATCGTLQAGQAVGVGSAAASSGNAHMQALYGTYNDAKTSFNSTQAMYDLGRTEAKEIA